LQFIYLAFFDATNKLMFVKFTASLHPTIAKFSWFVAFEFSLNIDDSFYDIAQMSFQLSLRLPRDSEIVSKIQRILGNVTERSNHTSLRR